MIGLDCSPKLKRSYVGLLVATQDFVVPVAEEPLKYTGKFLSVKFAKSAYTPGEKIRIIITVEVTRAAQWIDIFWHSDIIAKDTAGKQLDKVSASHIAVPGVFDRETYDTSLYPGVQTTTGLKGKLELYAEGSPAFLVATATFNVPLPGVPTPPPNGEIPPEEEEKKKFPWVPVGIGVGILAIGLLVATSQKR